MYILLQHYQVYKSDGLKEPDAIKVSTNNYWNCRDFIQSFVDEFLEKDQSIKKDENDQDMIVPNSFLTLDQIWNLFKSSDHYDKKSKLLKRDFLIELEKKIGPCNHNSPIFKVNGLNKHQCSLGGKKNRMNQI
jgi:hypothetical protein